MGKVEEAVRTTTLRLVRRELRGVVLPLARDLRALKRAVSRLDKAVSALERTAEQQARSQRAQLSRLAASEEEVSNSRLSAGLIRKLRARLGLTQVQMAGLVGVTGAAIAQWEGGTSTPKGENRATLVGLRKLGRRDVKHLLAEKGIPPAKRRRRTGGGSPKRKRKKR